MRFYRGHRRGSTGNIDGFPHAFRSQRITGPSVSPQRSDDEFPQSGGDFNIGRYENDLENGQRISQKRKPGLHINNQLREVDHLFHVPTALDKEDDIDDFLVNHNSDYPKSTSSSDYSLPSNNDLRHSKRARLQSTTPTFGDEYEPFRSVSSTQTPPWQRIEQITSLTSNSSAADNENDKDDVYEDADNDDNGDSDGVTCDPCRNRSTVSQRRDSMRALSEKTHTPSFFKRRKRFSEMPRALSSEDVCLMKPSGINPSDLTKWHGCDNDLADSIAPSIENEAGDRTHFDSYHKSTEHRLNNASRSGTWPALSLQREQSHGADEAIVISGASRERAHSMPSTNFATFNQQLQLPRKAALFPPFAFDKNKKWPYCTITIRDWFENIGMRLTSPSARSIALRVDDDIGDLNLPPLYCEHFEKPLRNHSHWPTSRLCPPAVTEPDLLSPKSSMSFQQQYNSNSEGETSFVWNHAASSTNPMLEDGLSQIEQTLAKELARRILLRIGPLRECGTSSSRATSQHQSSDSTQQTTASQTPATSLSSSTRHRYKEQKRPMPADDDEENEEQRHPTKRIRTSPGNPTKLFACPYTKFDPARYSEHNLDPAEKSYRSCSSKHLRDVSVVKQHLYRVHKRPDFYCGSCYQSFRSREEINAHNRQRPPCESGPAKYEEMMTDEQYETVKRRSPRNDQRESWYSIFEALFPNVERPPSPYVSTIDPVVVQHFVAFFRRYGPEAIRGMRDQYRRSQASSEQELSAQRIVDEAFEIALSIYLPQQEQVRNAVAEPRNSIASSPPTLGNTPEREELTPHEEVADVNIEAVTNEPLPVNRHPLPNNLTPNIENQSTPAMPENISPNINLLDLDPEAIWGLAQEATEMSYFDEAFAQYEITAGEEYLTGLIPKTSPQNGQA